MKPTCYLYDSHLDAALISSAPLGFSDQLLWCLACYLACSLPCSLAGWCILEDAVASELLAWSAAHASRRPPHRGSVLQLLPASHALASPLLVALGFSHGNSHAPRPTRLARTPPRIPHAPRTHPPRRSAAYPKTQRDIEHLVGNASGQACAKIYVLNQARAHARLAGQGSIAPSPRAPGAPTARSAPTLTLTLTLTLA